MIFSPVQFVYVDGVPSHQQTVQYSCGAKSIRTYQGGDLVNSTWLVKPSRKVKPDDIIGDNNNSATGKP